MRHIEKKEKGKAFGVMPLTVIPEGDIAEISDKREEEIAKEKKKAHKERKKARKQKEKDDQKQEQNK